MNRRKNALRHYAIYFRPFSIFLMALSIYGCSTLPLTTPINEEEQHEIRSKYFLMVTRQKSCSFVFETDTTIKFNTPLQNGTITGNLLIMEPAYLSFTSLGPFGQPILLYSSNQKNFKLLSIPDQRIYAGTVDTDSYRRYAPEGFEPGATYSWLTARVPQNGLELTWISRDGKGRGYWITFKQPVAGIGKNYVLFDPDQGVILQHILENNKGKILMDVRYSHFVNIIDGESPKDTNQCLVPQKIEIQALKGKSSIEILLENPFVVNRKIKEKPLRINEISAPTAGVTDYGLLFVDGTDNHLKYVEEDIRAVKRACRSTTVLKVILETSLLSDEEAHSDDRLY